ncbi:MAG: SGNH/GDSL hydrolase family protein [Chitinophagaceae bacterium]
MKLKSLLFVGILFSIIATKPVKTTKIIFFGDSITQAGVKKGGYIDRIKDHLNQKSLQQKYELVGAGIGGNKVYDLYLRMDEDVLAKDPQTVVIYVGINDVWHKTTSGTGTDLDKYEKFYVALIKKLQAKNIKVALCTPSVIGEKKDNTNPQDKDLNTYSDVIRRLAVTYSCTLIDLRKAFITYEEANNSENKESGLLTSDRVHLTDAGNQLVADEMIKGLAIK